MGINVEGKSIRIAYEFDDDIPESVVEELLDNPNFYDCNEVIFGMWGEPYDESAQAIIDDIIKNKDKFSKIEKLFIGDMEWDECEVSWILQGNYNDLWKAMPQLRALTIKGSCALDLGDIEHDNLESLTIICGGLGKNVIKSIENAKLKNLKKLLLYIGIDDYGFDGDISTIKDLVNNSNFSNLEYLGITDSDIEDDIVEAVFDSKYISQVKTLDFSNGSLSKKGGLFILDKIEQYPNIKELDLHHHYMDNDTMNKIEEKCKQLGIKIDTSEQEIPDEWDGEIWMRPMLTE